MKLYMNEHNNLIMRFNVNPQSFITVRTPHTKYAKPVTATMN